MKMFRFIPLFFLLPSLMHITNATNILYVTTDNDHYDSPNSSLHNLQYYVNNASKYFTSYTYLYFLPGQHHLNTDFIINSTTNFTVAGNRSNNYLHSTCKLKSYQCYKFYANEY